MPNNQHFFTASTVTVNASVKDIWNILEDVRGWINWDQRFEKIEYEGPFKEGVKFKIIPQGRTPQNAKFKVITTDTSFSYETQISLCVVVHSHRIENIGNFAKITCEIESIVDEGIIEEFSKKIWPQMQIGLPVALNNLVSLVENL
jgi:hypothetical protein